MVLAGCVGAAGDVSDPSFDRVLSAPDDSDLNLSYAKVEADSGRLLNAAAALERILLAHPNAHSVRLFYAVVLYRLNDLGGARQQLAELERVRLTPLQTAELNKYSSLIEHGESSTKLSGKVGAGVDVESDAIGALLNQIDFPGFHIAKNGAAAVASADLEVDHQLVPDGEWSGFAAASIYTRSSFAGPNADFDVGELRAGLLSAALDHSWSVGPVFRHYIIFDTPYLTEYGGQGQASWRYSTSLAFNASLEIVGQNYHEPGVDALVPFIIPGTHDGVRYRADIGESYRFDSRSTFAFDLGYEAKTAGYKAFSYDSIFANANYHALLGAGAYFDLQGGVSYFDYHARDFVFLLGRKRADLRSDIRAAVGAPLSAFSEAGATGDIRENLILEGAISFADRTSRFPLAPFHSLGGQLRLVWKFGQ
ncbi:MAG: hypothetical protein JOZ55_08635 [Alphaproteobacteria bacterium]|nr:hypothetical protein [Alphaproteobacteria bacterium]